MTASLYLGQIGDWRRGDLLAGEEDIRHILKPRCHMLSPRRAKVVQHRLRAFRQSDHIFGRQWGGARL
jgi:hypothetical protein